IVPALLEPDLITAMDRAAALYGGIDADVGLVVLSRRAQDARILGQVPLGDRGHHAAGAGSCDVQPNLVADVDRAANPVVLHEALFSRAELHHDVWTKAPHLEAPLRVQLPQAIERGRGQEVHDGTVEKRLLRQGE